MSNVVGQMVASFVPPLIVSARGIAAVQLYQVWHRLYEHAWIAGNGTDVPLYTPPPALQVYFFVVVLVMSLALLPEKPLRAPSPAAAIQWAKRCAWPPGST